MAGALPQYVWQHYLLPHPLLLSSFLVLCVSTRESKCRGYKVIRSLFTEEGIKISNLYGICWSKGKPYGETLPSLHSVDFHENQGGFCEGFSLAKIYAGNLISKE